MGTRYNKNEHSTNLDLGNSSYRRRDHLAQPCITDVHAHIKQPGRSHVLGTRARAAGMFAGENQSSSEATVTRPAPCINTCPSGVDVGEVMNIQAKVAGDLRGLALSRDTRLRELRGMCLLLPLNSQVMTCAEGAVVCH